MKDCFFKPLFTLLLALALLFSPRPAAAQSRSNPTPSSARGAIGKGENKQALSSLEANAVEAERNNQWQQASRFYRQASKLARVGGQLQRAITYGTKAFDLAEKAREPILQVQAIVQLVSAYRPLKQRAKSMEWLLKGIEILNHPTYKSIVEGLRAQLYREIGVEYGKSGDYQKAVEYTRLALKVHEERLTTAKSRRRKDANEIQNRAEQLVTILNRLAALYQETGDRDEARKTYQRALDVVGEAQLKTRHEGELYQGLGNLYFEQKDFRRAEENLKKALDIGEKLQHATVIRQASSQLGDLLRETRSPDEAIKYYRKAIDAIESTRSTLESAELRTSFFEGKGKTYAGIIQAYLATKSVEQAFNFNERGRSRAFLDILGSTVQLARGEMLEEERALQATLSALAAKMTANEADDDEAPDPANLKRERDEAQQAYNEFLAKVRKENKEQATLMNVEPLTLKDVQGILDPGVTLLEYFLVPDEILLWVVDKETATSVSVPTRRRELATKITALRNTISQIADKEKLAAQSQELHRLLITPALPYVKGKELIIVPHDVLHYLPFHALLSPQGKYLIEDFPIRFLSSASLMQFTREKRRASRETTLAMGNPSLGDPAYELRFAEREVRELARIYSKSDVFLKEQATRSKAVSLSPTHDILHFAVHAEFNEEDPMSSALLLARDGNDDGRLKVEDIFSLNLKTDMVVLSACETGLGKISSGDEIVGLTRAFIYAGTPSVITTLWKVNDRASYELMSAFYSNLKTMTKSEALRQAQLKTIKEFPQPFFWAAYTLTGEP